MMRRVILAALISLISMPAFGLGSIECFSLFGSIDCFSVVNFPDQGAASLAAHAKCISANSGMLCTGPILARNFQDVCVAVYVNAQHKLFVASDRLSTAAMTQATGLCVGQSIGSGSQCKKIALACDSNAIAFADTPKPPVGAPSPKPVVAPITKTQSRLPVINLTGIGNGIGTGVGIGIGLILVLIIYAARAPIINFIIHDNLPRELPVYGESIQALFKRTQRVNWYGRVVFGIVANLSMTKDQLAKVRRYWLGRVIAFDSLRRQRQNELARMHLQLAASVKTEPADKKALSQLWALIKAILLSVFYLFRALFSFLFGFLFIRITIAKLVRGAIIESKDLVLILQAKSAIEETANYLKEYIATADTFDGSDEVYDAK